MRLRALTVITSLTLAVCGALFLPGAQPPAQAVPQMAQNLVAQLAVNFASSASGVPIGRVLNIGNARVLAELSAIRAELKNINETLVKLHGQAQEILGLAKQNACETNAAKAGEIVASVRSGVRILGNIAKNDGQRAAYMKEWDRLAPSLGEDAQIKLHDDLVGAGVATGILRACGKAVEAADYPFLSAKIYQRMSVLLSYYQDAEAALLMLRVNQYALDGLSQSEIEDHIKQVRAWLPQQQQVIEDKRMTVAYFIDLRTHLTWMTNPYLLNGSGWEYTVATGPSERYNLRGWKLAQDYQVAELYKDPKEGSPVSWLHKVVGMTWWKLTGSNKGSTASPSQLGSSCYWSFHYSQYGKGQRRILIYGSNAYTGRSYGLDMTLAGPHTNTQLHNCYALFVTPELAAGKKWQQFSYG